MTDISKEDLRKEIDGKLSSLLVRERSDLRLLGWPTGFELPCWRAYRAGSFLHYSNSLSDLLVFICAS